jgi:hypothetical protein
MLDRRPLTPRLLLEWLAGRSGAPLGERVAAILTTTIVVVGLFLRARGYLWKVPAFWLDECSWAMLLVEQPLIELALRPIGFMLVSRWLAQAFSLSEPVLRAMPWLAGLATVLIAPPLARRLFTTAAARLLFVFVIALHPCAIDFSKEYKPYSVSLALHAALLLAALAYYESGRGKHLAWLLGVAVVGGPFAQDLVFAYPSVYLLAGYRAWRARPEHLKPIVATAAVILLLLLLQYLFIWRIFSSSDATEWGDKYNVFYTGQGKQSFVSWWLERVRDLAAFSGYRRRFWQPWFVPLETLEKQWIPFDRTLWVVLFVAGLVVLASRRRERALLLLLPLVTLCTFNALNFWPLGVFRTNIFALVYVTGVACMSLELPVRAVTRSWEALPALVLALAPVAILDRGWSDHKQALTYTSDFPNAIRTLLDVKLGRDQKSRDPLILDRRSCDPFRFYTQFHPSATKRFKRTIKRYFDVKCVTDDSRYRQALTGSLPREPNHAWTILHLASPVTRMMRRKQLGDAQVTYRERIGMHTLMGFWLPNAPPPAQPEQKPSADEAVEDAAESREESPDGR